MCNVSFQEQKKWTWLLVAIKGRWKIGSCIRYKAPSINNDRHYKGKKDFLYKYVGLLNDFRVAPGCIGIQCIQWKLQYLLFFIQSISNFKINKI
jgi:hypothetical protein